MPLCYVVFLQATYLHYFLSIAFLSLARFISSTISSFATLSSKRKISAFTMCRDTVVTFEQAFEVISNVIPLDNSYRSSDFSVPVIPPNFPGGANSVFLYRLVLALKPSFVIETGVGFGISSSAILKALFANSHGYLYSIDRPAFLNQREDSDVGLAVDTSLRSRWILHYGVDRDLLPKVLHHIKPSRPFIFHYDSDKSYFGRQWAFNLILKYSPSGTVLISDDSSDNFSFFDFCQLNHLTPYSINYDNKFLSFAIV